MKITLEEAKKLLEKLVAGSASGEEIVISQNGVPVASVGSSPARPHANGTPKRNPRDPGWAKGIITHISPDFDAPLDEFREYTE